MESLWNSLDVVSTIRTIVQWLAALSTIAALIFTMRANTLKNESDAAKIRRDAEEQIRLKENVDSAHAEARELKLQALSKQAEVEALGLKLVEADKRLSKAESAIKPIPFPERLRRLLSEIDPVILPSLKAGKTGFTGGITATQFIDLQKLAKEPGANRFITVSPNVRTGLGMGTEGITYGVDFTLDPRLLTE